VLILVLIEHFKYYRLLRCSTKTIDLNLQKNLHWVSGVGYADLQIMVYRTEGGVWTEYRSKKITLQLHVTLNLTLLKFAQNKLNLLSLIM
jgi:hypothetical protein